MIDIMIDIETLSLTNDATILSIGACEFDDETIGATLYFELCPDQGRHIDPGAALWWAQQSAAFNDGLVKYQLKPVLQNLALFLDPQIDPDTNPALISSQFKGRVWANSPSFDCNIIRSAYDQYGMECPWRFYQEFDVRTIKYFLDKHDRPEFVGRKHNALDDAIHQAKLVQSFLRVTGLEL